LSKKNFAPSRPDMWATLMPMCRVGYQGDIILYFNSKKVFWVQI
jgi:hypothetical protein